MSAKPEALRLIAAFDVPRDADAASDQLAAMGPEVIPFLAEAVCDLAHSERQRQLSAITLAHMAEPGPTTLLALLEAEQDDVADLAAHAMRWPPVSLLAEPVLVGFLARPEQRWRLRGLRGLQAIGIDLSIQYAEVLAAADDPDPVVRAAADRVIRRWRWSDDG